MDDGACVDCLRNLCSHQCLSDSTFNRCMTLMHFLLKDFVEMYLSILGETFHVEVFDII